MGKRKLFLCLVEVEVGGIVSFQKMIESARWVGKETGRGIWSWQESGILEERETSEILATEKGTEIDREKGKKDERCTPLLLNLVSVIVIMN